ncbi:hypothetical protein N7486_007037 [Penicillium sp. IBT 16267x]|nr:hypothetical protein N7486_007037 [Penicillium sp. IBT 16267x]
MSDDVIDPDYIWPLVLLTELSVPSLEKLIGLVQSTLKDDLQLHSADYFGAFSKSMIFLMKSISAHGPCRDSQSNIHALAVLAYRSGRPRIIVADEATKRQLSGKYLPDADLATPNDQGNVISVILISTRCDTKSGGLSVFAKRAICSAQENMTYFDEADWSLVDPDPQPSAFRSIHKAWGPLWTDAQGFRGLKMLDPYQEPFTSRTGDVLGREYYTRAAVTALVIFLMYPSTAQEREETLQILQESPKRIFADEQRERKWLKKYSIYGVPDSSEYDSSGIDSPDFDEPDIDEPEYTALDVTFELIPWEQHRMKTRLDLLDFWDEYRVWGVRIGGPDSMPLICLHEPMSCHDEAVFNVLTFKDNPYPSPVVMRNMSFGDIWDSMTRFEGFNHCWRKQNFHEEGSEEEFWHPDRPFFYNPPPWSPMVKKDRLRTVVSLTNKLSDAAKENLERIMLRFHEVDNWDDLEPDDIAGRPAEGPEYSFVPWKSGDAGMVDGKLKDIWNFLENSEKHPMRGLCDFVCVDQQFEVDGTVILVASDVYEHPHHDLLQHLPFPGLRGFTYARAPAHSAYCGNMNWINEDAIDDWMDYRRQGWPAPEMLPDDEGVE